MTWTNRLRLGGSIIAALLVMSLLVLLFNQRQHTLQSQSATIQAPSYSVASNYGGTVVDQNVHVGDNVTAGQKLFTVNSIGLQQDVARGVKLVNTTSMAFDAAKGTITYKASAAGIVTGITAEAGSYIGNGQPLATITQTVGRVVVATFVAAPRDYGRIQKGATADIVLPDNSSISGTVESATVETDQGHAVVTLRVTSAALDRGDLNLIATDGAPVTVRVHLTDNGILAGPSDAMVNMLRKAGLR